ncbi:MAG: TOBE domain-containing protein, partial [Microbacterium gubbeenense]
AVLKDGVLQQVGSPRDLYETPQNDFVAGFIGSPAMNLFAADTVEGGVKVGTKDVPVERQALDRATGSRVTIGIRPEDFVVVPDAEGGLQVTVKLVEELGSDGYLYGEATIDGEPTEIVVRVDGRSHPMAGDVVTISPIAGRLHVFDAETGLRLIDKAIA